MKARLAKICPLLPFALIFALLLASCATESKIFGLKNITLDGENCIKTQMFYVHTGDNDRREPIANREFVIFVFFDDKTEGEIYGKTDRNGWVYVKNIPDGKYSFLFASRNDKQTDTDKTEQLPPAL